MNGAYGIIKNLLKGLDMGRKKKYNILEDAEMVSLLKEYSSLRDWWQVRKEKLSKKKKGAPNDSH